MMRARFKSDIEVGAASVAARHAERLDLGMGAAGRLRTSFAGDPPVTHEHRADRRVGAGAANRLAGKFDSPPHVVRGDHGDVM